MARLAAVVVTGDQGFVTTRELVLGPMPVAVPNTCPKWTATGYDRTMIDVRLERVEALEFLAMTLAHLNHSGGHLSPRVATLISIRDNLAQALREEPQ